MPEPPQQEYPQQFQQQPYYDKPAIPSVVPPEEVQTQNEGHNFQAMNQEMKASQMGSQPLPVHMDPAMQAQLREMEMNFMDKNYQEKSR